MDSTANICDFQVSRIRELNSSFSLRCNEEYISYAYIICIYELSWSWALYVLNVEMYKHDMVNKISRGPLLTVIVVLNLNFPRLIFELKAILHNCIR